MLTSCLQAVFCVTASLASDRITSFENTGLLAAAVAPALVVLLTIISALRSRARRRERERVNRRRL